VNKSVELNLPYWIWNALRHWALLATVQVFNQIRRYPEGKIRKLKKIFIADLTVIYSENAPYNFVVFRIKHAGSSNYRRPWLAIDRWLAVN
jgi:hypothetical protein